MTAGADMKPGSFPPSADTLARFAAIVGARYAISSEADMAAYMREWRDRYQLCLPDTPVTLKG